ncbi:prepilin-type N-terminal cleavage/methylation domain-containing protein [Sulfuriroseicoccus oceanibius]|uniref:Prepilin-type N-terminal cleavage/methylation domain-containing protein n=1 Tax=Sulfuriroseicoccus oceanibius TaxID=2707525 RepID=A0A7T7F006_9BACT|nr:prepilin-type N-terminal cleavage/methylation domain-containing protein [Sulfuriroseicoccus oceanibius]QQL44296.1 prepilin-type N-terminal cleavage/methylation domain-containing protein [Sulfuriroseicoccus oceanibius]
MKISMQRMKRNGGFSLVEVAIALAIVAVVVLAVVGLLGPAAKNVEDIVAVDELNRLQRGIEAEMTVVRPNELAEYKSGFDKAFKVLKGDGLVYAFFYRAPINNGEVELNPSDKRARPDTAGILTDQRVGVDYMPAIGVFTQAAVDNGDADDYFDAAEGRIYLAKIELLRDLLETVPEDAQASFDNAADSDDFIKATLPASISYYEVESLDQVLGGNRPTELLEGIAADEVSPIIRLNTGFRR